jgi:LemA protein
MAIVLMILGPIIAVGLFFIAIYNRLIQLKNRVANAFAQVDVQLKRRYDLIPNLVEVAKKYMSHEKDTLEAVVQARNGAVKAGQEAAQNPTDPQSIAKLMGAEKLLGAKMGGFFALAERYPDLKADATMMQLSEELTSTENKVAFSRQAYNDSVMHFNTAQETFPSNFVSGMFQFKKATMFEIENEAQREPVKVNFD